MDTSNKQLAIKFMELIAAGKIDEAYQSYINMDGKHHNAFFPAGFSALKKAMEENQTQFPHKQMVVKNVIGDGNLVAVHSHITIKPKEIELSAVHIFRFQNGKIVEMWDVGQRIPQDLPNKDGAF